VTPLSCRIFGHRPAFSTVGRVMNWECDRGCGKELGSKRYPSAEDARRYATSFNRRDTADLGKRAPLLGLLPLRLWRAYRTTRSGRV
jgi:hypothetical protein